MKRTNIVFNRLIIALALATQLFLLAPPPTTQAAEQNTNTNTNTNIPSTTAQTHGNHSAMRPSPRNRCRERCARQYRQCLRGVVNPKTARCRQRYNLCLRRCPR